MSLEDRKAYRYIEPPVRKSTGTGSSKLLNKSVPTTAGFTCDACQATFSAYDAYLDHCHGRVHLQRVGGTAKPERIDDPSRIRARLQWLKEQQTEEEGWARRVEQEGNLVVEETLARRQKESEERRGVTKKEKPPNPPLKANEATEIDEEEAALMTKMLGITSFK